MPARSPVHRCSRSMSGGRCSTTTSITVGPAVPNLLRGRVRPRSAASPRSGPGRGRPGRGPAVPVAGTGRDQRRRTSSTNRAHARSALSSRHPRNGPGGQPVDRRYHVVGRKPRSGTGDPAMGSPGPCCPGSRRAGCPAAPSGPRTVATTPTGTTGREQRDDGCADRGRQVRGPGVAHDDARGVGEHRGQSGQIGAPGQVDRGHSGREPGQVALAGAAGDHNRPAGPRQGRDDRQPRARRSARGTARRRRDGRPRTA